MITNQTKPKGNFRALDTRINNDNTADIWIYGVITDDKWSESDVTSFDVVQALNKIPADTDRIIVHLNSPGGDVFEGLAIYNTLQNCGYHVDIIGEGMVASIASVIAMAGDTFTMTDNCMMLLHNPILLLFGGFNKHDMAKMTEELDKVKDNLLVAYEAKTGLSLQDITNLIDGADGQGTLLNANEALELGFCDSIVKKKKKMVASIALHDFRSRGHIVPLNIYALNQHQKEASKMRKFGKPKATKQNRATKAHNKPRPKAELLPCECPYCNSQCNLNTQTYVVTLDPYEEATVATPYKENEDYDPTEYQARVARNFRNEEYKVECPNCHKEYEAVVTSDGTVETYPLEEYVDAEGYAIPQAKAKKAKPKARRKSQALHRPRMEDYYIKIEEDETTGELIIIADEATKEEIKKYLEESPDGTYDAELYIEYDKDSYVDPEEHEEDEETSAIVAVANERKRINELDRQAKLFPQYANEIDRFKQNGKSPQASMNFIMASMEKEGGSNTSYLSNSRADAEVLNKTGNPTRTNKRENEVLAMRALVNEHRGVK
jgi:ATP-dependent Clp protease protease subunit